MMIGSSTYYPPHTDEQRTFGILHLLTCGRVGHVYQKEEGPGLGTACHGMQTSLSFSTSVL